MNIDLDIAATVSAVFWPLITLVILLAYRKTIPSLANMLASRVTKLEFAGVSLELAVAKPFAPDWSAGVLDLRHQATSMEINDSYVANFRTQLSEGGKVDFAEINLGEGNEWLTSRLFIMAIVFARVKGIRSFVFVETIGGVRKRYLGSAEPEKIHWALARHYPKFEEAYAAAYSVVTMGATSVIVSNQGRLGSHYSRDDVSPNIRLLNEFLQRVQTSPIQPHLTVPEQNDWVSIAAPTNTFEYAHWITSELLEKILGDDLNRSTMQVSGLRSMSKAQHTRLIMAIPERYIAVVMDDQRFDHLVDRNVVLEQVAKELAVDESEKK